MKIYDELVWRGLIKDVSSPEIEEKLNNGGLTFYIGTDPTGDSLHIGHFSSFLISKRLKDAGHNPILLVGGATGLIGDPKPDTERPMITKEQVQHNFDCLKAQAQKIFGFEVVNNYDWSKDLNFIDFLRDYGKYFNVNQFKDIEKLKEIEEIIIQYDGLAKLKDAKVVSGEQRINREDLSDEFKNVVSLEATNNTKRNILFNSEVFTIKEGKNIEKNDKNSIIVHEEFAKQNNLKLGDEVDLELLDIEKSGKIKSHKFKIIGSFSGKKQETYTGLSSDFSENMVFVDYSTSQEILNNLENNKIANKILMYSGSLESTDLVLNKLKELKIDESKYFVEKDSNAFEESLESVSGIKHIIKIMTYSIMLGGMIVLSLILVLWLRERIYEIGIFLSIGTSKMQIIMQFILELIFISMPSIISSLLLGNVLLKVIVDGFINSEDSIISGGSLINNSGFMLNIGSLGQSYLILISIIVLSVVFASSLILIKKPKEILSKIS